LIFSSPVRALRQFLFENCVQNWVARLAVSLERVADKPELYGSPVGLVPIRACVHERSSSQLVSCTEEILKQQSGKLTNRSAKSAPCREQWREWRSVLNFVTRDYRFCL